MKKLIFLILSFLIFGLAFADEPTPLLRTMKPGEKITLKGMFCIFSGTPPNIRFVTGENKIIGIETGEDCENEDVRRILTLQQKNNCVYEAECVFEYLGNENLAYYKNPLMCFSAAKIKILNCKIQTADFEITIKNPKLAKKSRQLKADVQIFNASNESAEYSNQNLFVAAGGKNYRAHSDSPASNLIDFAFIEIPAKSSVKQKVCFFTEDIAVLELWFDTEFSYGE